jgi:hypothetical protein
MRNMSATDAMSLFARETSVREGPAPSSLPGALSETATYAIARDEFLLRLPNGLRYHYERGKGVTVARPQAVPEDEIALFLNGSVYGAIAWINGYVPLHAASVVQGAGVHAFSGPSQIGKSTLAARLGASGLPLFCDDVLVLDLKTPDIIMCVPGHRQSKLWSDALALTGAEAGQRVRETMDKYYAAPLGGVWTAPLPLVGLNILDFRARQRPSFNALKGAERFARVSSSFYRPHFGAVLLEYRALFGIVERISRQVKLSLFERPKDKAVFEDGVGLIAAAISQ